MNDTTLETFLLRAPAPAAPADLLARLQENIALASAPRTNGVHMGSGGNFLRRWLPALAFGVFLLSCFVLIGMQASWINQLRRDQEKLRTVAANLPQLREEVVQLENTRAQQAELVKWRANAEEASRLRSEAEQLRPLPGQIARLRVENALVSSNLIAGGNSETFFEEAKKESERMMCVNNLKQLGLAARLWAMDHKDVFPASLVVMSNELVSVKVLICPADSGRNLTKTTQWADFEDGMSSYQFFGTGGKDDHFPESVLAKCPLHHNYLLADGSVQRINPNNFRDEKREGRLYLQRLNPSQTP